MNKSLSSKKFAKVQNQAVQTKNISWVLYLVILVFTVVLYGNTLSNQYALDDLYAISGNKFTQQGFDGIPKLLSTDFFKGYYGDQKILLTGGRYRPLSLITFAIEYQFFGENPGMGHFINLLLYALSGCLLFYFLRKLFTENAGPWYLSLPFVATLLFIGHPVHTEVVANIKGRDEILSLMGSIVTAIFYLKFLDKKSYKYLVFSFISFFLACLSKENALLFIVFIPLAVYYFRSFSLKDNAFAMIPLVIAGLLFLLIRMSVIGNLAAPPSTELLDNPFVQAGVSQRYATILFTLGMYIKLLFYPHPLTWDYYPYHISLMNWGDLSVILSLVFYILLIVIAILGIRKKTLISFSIWVFLISIFLVSNIIFQVGTFMAERFLYLPSVAFSLIIAWLMVKKLLPAFKSKASGKMVMMVSLFVILLMFSMKTISRNRDWKDDFTLHTTDIETSVNSAKGNNIAGQWYAWAASQPAYEQNKQALFEKAYQLMKKAVTIHPDYQDAWFRLGNIVFDYKRDVDSTVNCYIHVLKKDPNEENVFKNMTMVINSVEDVKHKIELWEKILFLNPNRYEPNFYLANFYFKIDLNKSVAFAEKAREAKPDDAPNLKVLASALLNQNKFKESLPVYDAYLKLVPTDTIMIKTRINVVNYLKHPF